MNKPYLSFILALAALFLFACGGEDTPNEEPGDGDAQGCEAAGLTGTWATSGVTLTINEDLSFHCIGVNETTYNVTGQLSLNGCEVSITDLNGVNPCPPTDVGVYTFALSGNTLSMTLKSDACPGRVMGIGGKTLTKQ